VKRDYGRAATYFTLAVAQSHVVAMYELARMHHYGMGAQHSCTLAVQFYKRVAERGPWASIMKEAFELYQQGDYDGALLKYERAAEQGYEVAQSNAAWIYDKGLSSLYSDGNTTYQLAFEYFRNSAEQKNAASLLKLGDYYFYGLGTPVNYEKAALYYQAASDMRNAQAAFNVGYLHQVTPSVASCHSNELPKTGLGLPKDLHLAKRYYDMALEMEPDAYIAIYLALGRLILDFIYEGNTVYPSLELWGFKWDSVLLALLTSILFLCVVVKQQIR
jgi:SEL1 protein